MYWRYFGLREEPFRLTSDVRFLHLAEPHLKTLTALLLGIIHHKGLLLLTGPIGAGKTTMLYTMLQFLGQKYKDEQALASALVVNPVLTPQEFLEMLLLEFRIENGGTSKPRQLLALHEFLRATERRGSTALLMIDEAHLLKPEVLDEVLLLTNLDGPSGVNPLQIVLCGQPDLTRVLSGPRTLSLQQRIAVRTQLRPLSFPETCAYVDKRLQAAGLEGPSPFPTSALRDIFSYSRGLPRVINLLCDGCLELECQAHRPQVQHDTVRDVATMFLLSPAGES